MSDLEYTSMKLAEIELACKKQFNVNLHVKEVLFDTITSGIHSYTTIFKTDHNDVYALCVSDEKLKLSDVQHAVKSMNMDAEEYLAPGGDKNYFLRLGYVAFLKAYPGRKSWNTQEALFYQTLTPYAPALVKISKINGEIRRYNSVAARWQKVYDFSYAKMRVQ